LTYHRAFDAGLIYLDERYEMRLSASRVTEITALGRAGGLQGLGPDLFVQFPLHRVRTVYKDGTVIWARPERTN
jgi:hypothetical protein